MNMEKIYEYYSALYIRLLEKFLECSSGAKRLIGSILIFNKYVFCDGQWDRMQTMNYVSNFPSKEDLN